MPTNEAKPNPSFIDAAPAFEGVGEALLELPVVVPAPVPFFPVAVVVGTNAVIGTVPVSLLPLTKLPLVWILSVKTPCPLPVAAAFLALNGAGVITVL